MRELRNDFAKIARWLEDGEEVAIHKRGKVIGRITPEPGQSPTARAWPDFAARLRKAFGKKVTPDSQALIDEGRGSR